MKRIFVAGHQGMVGKALCSVLSTLPEVALITRSKSELNLLDQAAVNKFFANAAIDEVYLAAAKVGGILANSQQPAAFIYENIQIAANVIHAAHCNDVQKLLFLGSSCIYPRLCAQPITESALLTDVLEPTNEPYAIAKIAGIKLCESYNRQYGRDYRSVMPTNLYGPGDNFHAEHSHVIPALLRRFHDAKVQGEPEVTVWGSGTALREFMFVDDLARACQFVMQLSATSYQSVTSARVSHLNVGSGTEISIMSLAQLIADVVGYQGKISWDLSKPDGTPRKLLDSSKLQQLGFKTEMALDQGLAATYNWMLLHPNLRGTAS